MERFSRYLSWCLCIVPVLTPMLSAQEPIEKVPGNIFLPFASERISEPGIMRVYKQEDGSILPPERQPRGYPKKVDASYVKSDDEAIREHRGTDYTSRDQTGKPVPLDFKAGVYGTVVEARVGIIKVEIDEIRNRVEFLHNSKTYVSKGDKVTPDDRLGMTGNINPDTGKPVPSMGIHLHVQAKSKNGAPLNPDEVLAYARRQPSERREAKFFLPMGVKKPIPPFSASDFEGSKDGDFYYEVWGTSAREPSGYRLWSESFNTMAGAKARLQEIQHDHAKGGLLESDPDKPLKLEIRKTSRQGKPTDDGPLTGTFWIDTRLGLKLTFFADGTFTSAGKGHTLEGTWKLAGTAFSATLPDKNRFVSHMSGQLQSDSITYQYYVTHPDKGRSGVSDTHTLKRQK